MNSVVVGDSVASSLLRLRQRVRVPCASGRERLNIVKTVLCPATRFRPSWVKLVLNILALNLYPFMGREF